MEVHLRTSNIKKILFLLTVSIFLSSVDSFADHPATIQYRDARFKDLESIDTLEKLFTKDSGKIRLFLLMSPT